jgi:hypothetical protein
MKLTTLRFTFQSVKLKKKLRMVGKTNKAPNTRSAGSKNQVGYLFSED